MSFDLFTDASVDLPRKAFAGLDATVIPMRYFMGDGEYQHRPGPHQMGLKQFYETLKAGADLKTSAVNIEEFVECFTPSLQAGRDVLYIGVSGGLSATCGFAVAAGQMLREQFPQRRVICIDSLAAATAQGILLLYAAQLRARGMDLDQVAEAVLAEVPHIAIWLAVEDLGPLRKSGRVSGMVAAVSTALGIRPVLKIDEEGKLGLGGTVRGKAKSMKFLVEQLKKNFRPSPSDIVYVMHSNCEPDAMELAALVETQVPGCHTQIAEVGIPVGTHVGSGALALCYCCEKR